MPFAKLQCKKLWLILGVTCCSVASEVVALLDLLGTVSGVDHTVLGLTVLAWGNSLGDLSTNVAMARCCDWTCPGVGHVQ